MYIPDDYRIYKTASVRFDNNVNIGVVVVENIGTPALKDIIITDENTGEVIYQPEWD